MVQGVTDKEIIVGNSAALRGIFATTGDPIVAGIKAYFDKVNSEGGIDGRTIRLLHEDDQYNPDLAKRIFNMHVNEKKVFAYVSHFGAPTVDATLSEAHRIGLPIVGFATGMGRLYSENAQSLAAGANCYPIQPIYITEGRAMVARSIFMSPSGRPSRLGVIYTNDYTGNDISKGVKIQCEILNIPLTSVRVEMNMSNLETSAYLMKKADVDFVIVASAQAIFPTLIGALADQNINKPAITTYLNSIITIAYQAYAVLRNKFEIYALSWLNYEGERLSNLEHASKWLGDYAMNGYAHCGWTCAFFLCEGLQRLRGCDITWESFKDAMESAAFRIPFGGEVDYRNGKRMGTSEMSLVQLNMSSPTGWKQVDGLKSFHQLLGSAKDYNAHEEE